MNTNTMSKVFLGRLRCLAVLGVVGWIGATAPCRATHAKVADLMAACNLAVQRELFLAATTAGLDPDPDGYRLVARTGGTVATLPLRDPERASAEDWRRGVRIGFVVFQHTARPETVPAGEYVLVARIVDRAVETYLVDLHHREVHVKGTSAQLILGCNNQPEPGEGYICLNLCSCGFLPWGGGVACFTITSCFTWNVWP